MSDEPKLTAHPQEVAELFEQIANMQEYGIDNQYVEWPAREFVPVVEYIKRLESENEIMSRTLRNMMDALYPAPDSELVLLTGHDRIQYAVTAAITGRNELKYIRGEFGFPPGVDKPY